MLKREKLFHRDRNILNSLENAQNFPRFSSSFNCNFCWIMGSSVSLWWYAVFLFLKLRWLIFFPHLLPLRGWKSALNWLNCVYKSAENQIPVLVTCCFCSGSCPHLTLWVNVKVLCGRWLALLCFLYAHVIQETQKWKAFLIFSKTLFQTIVNKSQKD